TLNPTCLTNSSKRECERKMSKRGSAAIQSIHGSRLPALVPDKKRPFPFRLTQRTAVLDESAKDNAGCVRHRVAWLFRAPFPGRRRAHRHSQSTAGQFRRLARAGFFHIRRRLQLLSRFVPMPSSGRTWRRRSADKRREISHIL